MKDVYKPKSGAELAIIKSLLFGEGIPFNVLNEGFGSLEIGPQIGLFNERIIQVPDDHAQRASEIIQDYLSKTIDVAPVENYSFYGKVINVVVNMCRRWKRRNRENNRSNKAL
jgi:hypothetical protein